MIPNKEENELTRVQKHVKNLVLSYKTKYKKASYQKRLLVRTSIFFSGIVKHSP